MARVKANTKAQKTSLFTELQQMATTVQRIKNRIDEIAPDAGDERARILDALRESLDQVVDDANGLGYSIDEAAGYAEELEAL